MSELSEAYEKHLMRRQTIVRRVEEHVRRIPNAVKFVMFGEREVDVYFDNIHAVRFKILRDGLELRRCE